MSAEADFQFEIAGKTRTLAYTVDSICAMEAELGKAFFATIGELQEPGRMSMTTVRAMLWAGLRRNHPDITLADAGNIIGEADGLKGVLEAIVGALAKAPYLNGGKKK